MCYDISFMVSMRQLSDYFPDLIFDQQMDIDFESTVHIMGHSYGQHPIIYRHQEDKKLHCQLMEWGCIPFYVKDVKAYTKQRASMLNARSERILGDTKSYWNKIRNRRCLIPVSAIYEHRKIVKWTKKVPYFIKPKDQELFFLPGLYSAVEVADTETGEMIKTFTFTLITTSAENNFVMKNIHNDGDNAHRMPLFLPFELSKKWLDHELSENEYQEILDYKINSGDLYYHPVYTIRSPKERPDGKRKNEYWEWEKLPPLGEGNPILV